MSNFDYQKELFKWQYNMVLLQKKYAATPAGITSEKADEYIKIICEEQNQYETNNTSTLMQSTLPEREAIVGRDKEFANLKQQFDKFNNVFLYGVGGIGKSIIAREYMYMVRDEYDIIIYAYVDDTLQNLICNDDAFLISNMQYRQEKYGKRRHYFTKKLEIINKQAQNSKILLVIDDFNNSQDRDLQLILDIPCHKLFTSRINPEKWSDKSFYKQISGIEIKELDRNKLFDFYTLYSGSKNLTDSLKNKLYDYYDRVNGHPLKLKVMIKNNNDEISAAITNGIDILSSHKLKKIEKDVLMYLSILPVTGIFKSLFLDITDIDAEVIETLKNQSLVQSLYENEHMQEIISLHPVVAENVRANYSPNVNNCNFFIRKLGEYMDGTKGVITWERTYTENRRLEPYVFAILRAFPKPVPWLVLAYEEFATFLWVQQYYEEAQKLAVKIYNEAHEYYDEKNPIVARESLRVAAAFYNATEFEKANEWYIRGYNMLMNVEKKPDECCRQLLIASTKVIRLQRLQRKYKESLKCFENSQKIYNDLFSRKNVSESVIKESKLIYSYLLLEAAKTYFEIGDFSTAENFYKEIEDRHQLEEENGYRVIEFLEFKVNLLQNSNKLDKAEGLIKELLDRALNFRSEEYYDVLKIREKLADILYIKNELFSAKKQYEKIIIVIQKEYSFQKKWLDSIVTKYKKC